MSSFAYSLVCLQKIVFRLVVPLLYKDKKERKKHLKALTTNVEKKYLRRYLPVLAPEEKTLPPCPKIIWFCWFQGMEKAPEIVRKCYQSIVRHCPDYDIRIVTENNMLQYVDIPACIRRKYAAGQITRTHFSDLLRLALLDKHGGLWIDATVFLTAPLPDYITSSPFFAYHAHGHLHNNSWLIKASAGDMLVRNLKNLLFAYWQKENRLINYFLYHLFFDLMTEENEILAKHWRCVPVVYDDCYDLEHNFFTPFTDELWRQISQKTSIHKLSYKYKQDKPFAGTFLEKFLTGGLDKVR